MKPWRVVLPRPKVHQIPILESDARFKVACCGRRFGKTLFGLIAVLTGHGPGRCFRGALFGANIWWVAPTYGVASKIWRDLKAALRFWPDLAKNEVDRRIEFPGGGSVAVKSAHDPDALRGDGLDGVVVDEAAFCPEAAWTLSLRAALADKQGWAIFISTPNGENWFYELFRRGQAGDPKQEPGWVSWQRPTSDNPTIPPAEIEAARKELGSFAFAREFLAKFLVPGGGMFKREAVCRYSRVGGGIFYNGNVYGGETNPLVTFASADLAVTKNAWSDFVAVVKWGKANDGTLFVLDVYHDKVGAGVVKVLASLCLSWAAACVVLEAGGTLQVLNEQVREAQLVVHEVSKQADKVTKAQPLAAAIESGKVVFPDNAHWLEALLVELCAFPDPGSHDDRVDALALGVLASPPSRGLTQRRFHPRRRDDEDERENRSGGWRIGR